MSSVHFDRFVAATMVRKKRKLTTASMKTTEEKNNMLGLQIIGAVLIAAYVAGFVVCYRHTSREMERALQRIKK